MNETTTVQKIECIIHELVKEQQDHLRRGRVERTFTSDFAERLWPLFKTKTISVDTFYNKHHGAVKRLQGKVIELDIAIHERGVDENNLIAIELETNNNPTRDDLWKIEELTQELGGYGYRLGLFLVVGIFEKAGEILSIEWYKKGRHR